MPVMYRGIALDQQTADADRAAIMQSGDLALQCKGENRLFLGRRFFVGWIVELGYLVFKTSQAEFSSFVAESTEKWANIIRAANIRAE
jgi:hypothetical protein